MFGKVWWPWSWLKGVGGIGAGSGLSTGIVDLMGPSTKHALHCCLFAVFIVVIEILYGGIRLTDEEVPVFDPIERYGVVWAIVLYVLRFMPLLALPQALFNFLGVVVYNAFPEKVALKGSPLLAPFICIRMVTRGDFPDLVKRNLLRNMNTCQDVGLENFMMEVVTDKAIHLPKHARIREVVVPSTYRTKTGALFKARALQYCLEDEVNILSDSDYIVHLDEETILTRNSVRGILNFAFDGKYQFGQGMITYANEEVVNWMTTLADSYRVGEDMGKLRFQFNALHKPLFNWKGSYVVSQVGAERKVTYDHGIDGSIAEDCFFGMAATRDGYLFSFIEGEMWEKSPFTIHDFLQQRKRWMQGIYLVVHNGEIPFRTKFFLGMSLYAWLTLPFSTSNVYLAAYYPVNCNQLLDTVSCFIMSVTIYMYVLGVMKSFSLYRFGIVKFFLCVVGALLAVPFNALIENVAIVWALFGNKHRFYVVKKETKPPIDV